MATRITIGELSAEHTIRPHWGMDMTGQQITTAAELDALPIYEIVFDRNGEPWIRTHDGLACIPDSVWSTEDISERWGDFTRLSEPQLVKPSQAHMECDACAGVGKELHRVKPCREEVARAIRLAGDTGNNSARLIAESERQADAILALFDAQPTVAEVRADDAPMSTETPALPTSDLVRGWDQGYAAAIADAANGTRTLNPHRSALLDEMARIPAQSETDAFPRCPHEECEAGYHHWHYKSDGMPSSRFDLDLHMRYEEEFEHQETDDCTRCYGPRVVR